MKKRRNLIFSLVVLFVIILTSAFIFISSSKILPRSSADLSITDGALNVKFNIINQDKNSWGALLHNLGVDNVDSVNLKLNQSALEALSKDLPTTLSLNISDKDLKFRNQTITLLNSVTTQSFEISSGSGKLDVEKSGDSDFDIKISDPMEVIKTATSSAQAYLSDKLSPLFPILERVATINLSVHGKSISGEVLLK